MQLEMRLDDADIAALAARLEAAPAEEILAEALALAPGRVALLSSFGADSAVLLHLLARADPSVPVLMLDTLMLFAETIAYQELLVAHLGLTGLRRIIPDERGDPDRALHLHDSEACCALRKVRPLEGALAAFDVVISGRKRFQSGRRAAMPVAEADGAGRLRLNPLARWSAADLAAYMERHALPRHPLVARGYPSIGCAPCTSAVGDGEAAREGRWRGEWRDECGIHILPGGGVRKVG